jgi:GTP cyclohydrolase II
MLLPLCQQQYDNKMRHLVSYVRRAHDDERQQSSLEAQLHNQQLHHNRHTGGSAMKTYKDYEIDQTVYFLYDKATGDYNKLEHLVLLRGTIECIAREEVRVKVAHEGGDVFISLCYAEIFDTLDALVKAVEDRISSEAAKLRRPLEDQR